MRWLIDKIHVNIPFTMLYESYLGRFISNRLNPEIGLDAVALERFSLSEFSEIAEQLRSHELKITLHAPFIDLAPGSPDQAVRELTRHRFEQVIRLIASDGLVGLVRGHVRRSLRLAGRCCIIGRRGIGRCGRSSRIIGRRRVGGGRIPSDIVRRWRLLRRVAVG